MNTLSAARILQVNCIVVIGVILVIVSRRNCCHFVMSIQIYFGEGQTMEGPKDPSETSHSC